MTRLVPYCAVSESALALSMYRVDITIKWLPHRLVQTITHDICSMQGLLPVLISPSRGDVAHKMDCNFTMLGAMLIGEK